MLLQEAISTRPTVAKTTTTKSPCGRPQRSMILAMGNFSTPLSTEATMLMVGISECEENSLVT